VLGFLEIKDALSCPRSPTTTSLTSIAVSLSRVRGMISGIIGLVSARTILRTSLSERSRAPRIYSILCLRTPHTIALKPWHERALMK
jgi:hypothetical protein